MSPPLSGPVNIMASTQATADALLTVVREVATELHPNRREATRATLDSTFDRDIGFDSLARMELLMRIERRLGVGISDEVMATAETPRDLLREILAGSALRPLRPLAGPPAQRAAASEFETETPDSATTLIEVLDWHVARHPARPHAVLIDDAGSERVVSYGELEERSRAIAAALVRRGVEPGQTVAIMLPTSIEYFFCFIGILRAGGIPVPIYPPARPSQLEDHLRRHAGILQNALAVALITVPQAKPLSWLLKPHVPTLRTWVTVEELVAGPHELAGAHSAKPHDVAMLQYTSGSTGSPKGVILTHDNLLQNIRAMGRALEVTPADVFVSWLPLYHDMGLIGAWLGSLTFGFKFPVMSPLTFLAHPERWLWAIHSHRGTLSGGPNFCYELCVRKIDDATLQGLDLSSWRFAFNGAEPVSPQAMEAFSRRFARYGFDPKAMTPVYGLAEATLGVALPTPGHGPKIERVDRDIFQRTGRAVPLAPDALNALDCVACGPPLPGHQLRAVDTSGRELAEREEGRLEFRGPSATSGYYRNPEETTRLLREDWIDTGDMGYIAEGEVYVTGRVKDLIIRAGRNIEPAELEDAIGALDGMRKGCVAVFGMSDPRSGTERIVVLAETRKIDAAARERLRSEINDAAVALIGMAPDEVVLAPPHTVLKTSSGKIRRAASRALYASGMKATVAPVWLQTLRLAASAIVPQLRRSARAAKATLYSGCVWLLLAVFVPVTWIGCVLLPGMRLRWYLTRAMSRAFLALAGLRLTVRGLDHLPASRACVLVVNHASYFDPVFLFAALRLPMRFVAKSELLANPFARIFLKRLGTAFAERFDARRGIEDTGRLVQLLREGASLILFPEATFRRMPGLLPFRMGAFVAAAEAGVPIVTIVLRGTRSVQREGQWLWGRGLVSATVSEPIEPAGVDWNAAIALRDGARSQMLRLCGEPDLGEETALGPQRAPKPSNE